MSKPVTATENIPFRFISLAEHCMHQLSDKHIRASVIQIQVTMSHFS